MMPGTEGGPRGEVTRAGKHRHVWPDLGEHVLGGAPVDAGNRIQAGQRVRIGLRGGQDLLTVHVALRVDEIEFGQEAGEQEAMVGGHVARERPLIRAIRSDIGHCSRPRAALANPHACHSRSTSPISSPSGALPN